MRVGIAGMGKMGAAIAARLHETGMEVLVWNRTRYKAEAIGLPVAATLHDLCARSEAIITTVFDDLAAEEVYRGPAGLFAVGRGKLFIEMSTLSHPKQTIHFLDASRQGASFIECPVGGTTGPARAGQLLGLVGGEPQELELARPILEKLCRRIELIGPVGSGSLDEARHQSAAAGVLAKLRRSPVGGSRPAA